MKLGREPGRRASAARSAARERLARRRRVEGDLRVVRALGAPGLLAIALSAVGSAIYFALGVVAGDALGLTPVVFLLAGVFFVITMMTYVEGNSLHPERGGASTFARYAFNELWSFVAGWAILLDYLIVMAIGAVSVSHYLSAFWSEADAPGVEQAVAAVAIGFVAWSNVRGLGAERLGFLLRLSLVNLVLLLAVVAVGLAEMWDPGAVVDSVELGSTPSWDDLIFAAVIATVATTGVEAASGLAGEIRVGRRALRRVVALGTGTVLAVFVGISAVALMALPVENGSTPLGGPFIEAPVLGVVGVLDPAWLRDVFRYSVGAMGALVLVQAVNGTMLGLSRLTYSLATNRQIPSAAGRLDSRRLTPYVAIAVASVLAFGLALSSDVEFLAGIFAFGAMLAFTLAHLSLIVLRFREPDRPSAYRMPLSVRLGGGSLPLPAVLGTLVSAIAWVSVVVLHEGARIAGGIWMLAGMTLYVIHRRTAGRSLTQRFTIPAESLRETPEAEYGSILVPVFGGELDDEIVGTAGRLAADEADDGEGGAMIEALYVVEIPMSLPLDARASDDKLGAAKRALARAKEVGEEYQGVEVATATVRGRSAGAAIVHEARRRGVEAIVLAAEEPTRVRGGGLLGGRGRARNRVVGETTRYVLEKAPCRVILTAPPAGEEGTREGVAP